MKALGGLMKASRVLMKVLGGLLKVLVIRQRRFLAKALASASSANA